MAAENRHLIYVVDWLPPDFGAVGQYAALAARELAMSGRNVRLIGLTSGHAETSSECLPGGGLLEVTRLRAPPYERSRYRRRLVWTLRTNLRLVREVVRDRRSHRAEIIFTGAPPFMLFFIIAAKWLRAARLIYRTTDFYPEVLIATFGRRWWLTILERLTWLLRRRVDAFEVLGEDQRAILLGHGIDPRRVTLRRDRSPVAFHGDERPLAVPPELRGQRLLIYSGNYAVAHDVDTVVEGLIRHHRAGAGAFGLWLNATGSAAELVESRLRAARVPVARSQPCALAELPKLLVSADAHLISLRPALAGFVLPSKVYACIASGRPILFVGPATSDVDLLCGSAALPFYRRVEPGDADGFCAVLDRLAAQTTASPRAAAS